MFFKYTLFAPLVVASSPRKRISACMFPAAAAEVVVLAKPLDCDKPVADPAVVNVLVDEKSNTLEVKSALESVIVAVVVAMLLLFY